MANRIQEIINILNNFYKSEISFLEYNSAYQLLIAVILSAQTTDRQVNRITPSLFKAYPKPEDLMNADKTGVVEIIRPLGFSKVRAGHIINSAALLYSEYKGKVPRDFKDLLRFPGIGRKSANVVRGHIFKLPAIIVDTHFGRVTRRLGLTEQENPDKLEKELGAIVPEKEQMDLSMKLNKLGRDFCFAGKNPDCDGCPLEGICPKISVDK